tara:strand:+ start:143 stop:1150 length:1008 start_codon:yes stop_codon:yes gene_type:complete
MSATVRWGVLGVAGITEAMVPALLAAEGAELIGIASRRPAKAEAAAERYGVEAFGDYDALLADPRIDAVYLPVPNAQHAHWAERVIRAGKHLLCEKPFTVTEAEARHLAALADEHRVLVAEAFMYAHHPRIAAVRDLISSGRIGTVRALHTVFTFDASDELDHSGFQGAPGSGAVYDVGCYAIHASRYLLGAEPTAVTAHAAASAVHGDIDMSTALLLEFPDGVGATAQVSMWSADDDRIEITGSRGRLTIPHPFLCPSGEVDIVLTIDEQAERIVVPGADSYVAQVERFDAAVRGEAELLHPLADAIQGARVLEAATASWRQGERVALAPVSAE